MLLLLLFTMTAAAQDEAARQGCRRGTLRSQSMMLRRGAAGGQTKRAGGDFYKGNRHQLAVLVSFTDKTFKDNETTTLAQWDNIFNTEGYGGEGLRGSVHDYFYSQSSGIFNLTFDLQYVQLSQSIVTYRSTGSSGDDENSQYLVQHVMNELQTRDINWSLYDWNDDGFVNQLLIIFAGKGQNSGGGTNSIWAHQWWMSEHLKDRQPGVYCDPIPVSYGSKTYKVDCYCAFPELSGSGDYGSFGTLCHEYTHCFGMPDFYYGSSKIVGSWDLMDYGNYNGGGYCPPNYSAHERWLMGWLSLEEPSANTTVTDMPALADESSLPRAYLIRNDGCNNEYYIIENRQKKGWDTSLPGKGIVIFHVDYNPDLWCGNIDDWVNTATLKRYTIFAANNSSSATGWPYPYADNDELTNTSSPKATLNNANTDGSLLMSKPITNMSVTNGLASFTITVDPSAIEHITVAKGSYEVLYRQGPFLIVRDANGEVRKVMMK